MARRILLVEDSSMMRRMIGAMLTEEGYEVATAEDGREGLERARTVNPELILSDYEMPELDGPGFCRALKADAQLRGIPVLMLTSLGASESKVVGLDAGADDYIEKPKAPQDVNELFARIRAQLRIADLRRELAERNQELEAAQAKIAKELAIARKVQHALMPPAPKPRGALRFAVRYQPANQLGGDVYDFAAHEGTRLGALMVDVSGHGVNTALLSGMVKTLAAPLIGSDATPSDVLVGLDAAVGKYFPDEYFCTAFYLRIDEATGEFDFAGVGHPPALIVGPGGVRHLDSDHGVVGFGMLEGGVGGGTGRLEPGELLLIYTDGLPDVTSPSNEAFGTERVEAVLAEHRESEPESILAALEAAFGAHVAPGQPFDDINLVLVQYPAH
jgi:sigma-B regulation protein RsbU (phosphoserine phosphatase)